MSGFSEEALKKKDEDDQDELIAIIQKQDVKHEKHIWQKSKAF